MKKLISFILVLCMMLSFASCTFADSIDEIQTATFTKVKIPFPDDIEDRYSWLTYARYKDTKEPITL